MKVHIIEMIVDAQHFGGSHKKVVRGIISKGQSVDEEKQELLKVCKEVAEYEANMLCLNLSYGGCLTMEDFTQTIVVEDNNYIVQIRCARTEEDFVTTVVARYHGFEIEDSTSSKIYALCDYWQNPYNEYSYGKAVKLTGLNFDTVKVTTSESEALKWFEKTKTDAENATIDTCIVTLPKDREHLSTLKYNYNLIRTVDVLEGEDSVVCSVYEAPLN